MEKLSVFSKKCKVSTGQNVGHLQKIRLINAQSYYTCTKKKNHVTLNFLVLSCYLDAQPTESEKEIYNQVNVVLKDAEGILEDLQSYRGAGHEIREVKHVYTFSNKLKITMSLFLMSIIFYTLLSVCILHIRFKGRSLALFQKWLQ